MLSGKRASGIAAGLGAGALWGLVFVAPRMMPGLSAVDVASGRFLVYGLVSLIAMVWTGGGITRVKLPTATQALAALGLSVLGFTGYYLVLVRAIQDAGVEVPTLIIGLIPLWVMLLGKPKGLRWATLLPGGGLTALGLGLMVQSELAAAQLDAAHFWRGIAFAVLAMALWTAFSLLNAAWLKRHPEILATDWANWLGVATGLGAFGVFLLAGSDAITLLKQDGWMFNATLCIALGIGSAWLATILWNIASQRLDASLCGQLIVSETLFALLYAFVWDGHWPGLAQAGAAVLFSLGILAAIRAHD
jgi:drug/metabolite transporter (DMT)-like permease